MMADIILEKEKAPMANESDEVSVDEQNTTPSEKVAHKE